MTTNVGLVLRWQIWLDCLESALAKNSEIAVCFGVDCPTRVDESFTKDQPDVLLIDGQFPLEQVEAVARLAREHPTKVLVLGLDDANASVVRCLEAGATGFLPKSASSPDVVSAILDLARSRPVLDEQLLRSALSVVRTQSRRPRECALTPRELEILKLVAEGLCNKDIARELCVSLSTVKNHVHNILDKLDVENRWSAVAFAQQRAWLGGAAVA